MVQRELGVDVPQVLVEDVRLAVSYIAAAFYGHPAERLQLIGITGTKGKTTSSFLVKSILEEPVPEVTEEPAPEVTPEPAAAPEPAASGAEVMIGKKYVMTDADVNGYNMTAAQMGNFEYSILLQEDGAVTFVMADSDIPGLTWAYGKVPTEAGEVDGIVIDYYTQALNLVPTEKGFDVDYFGSMLMHFAPEDSAQ